MWTKRLAPVIAATAENDAGVTLTYSLLAYSETTFSYGGLKLSLLRVTYQLEEVVE